MKDFLCNSVYFGVLISVIAYQIGVFLKKKFRYSFLNPLLVSIILVILFLLATGIEYQAYNAGAKYLSYLLTPATVCLAIPLYEQIDQLKNHASAILLGILSGALTSMTCVLILCLLFRLDHTMYVTLLPKSITTAIGLGVSEELGGIGTITASVIILTGVIGNISANLVCKVFRITHPIAKGVGIGSASHAIGTTRALEMGEVEGAMSSLSIAVSGLITVILISFYAMIY
ncbi:MAG: LrgB family protein [Lachnospiraceae bacterium]|nr:LrgB family protein [Lachnospiraceae bacterium]